MKKVDLTVESQEEEEEGEVYDVEKIVAHKRKGKKLEYLVKWVNYSDSENTWEPESHLDTAEEKLRDYFDSLNFNEKEKVYKYSPLIRKIFKGEDLPFMKSHSENKNTTKKEKEKPHIEKEKQVTKIQSSSTESDTKIEDDNYLFYQRQNFESEEEENDLIPNSPTKSRKPTPTKKESFNIKGARKENDELFWAVESNGKMVVYQNQTMKRYHPEQLIAFYESHIQFIENE